MSIIILGLDDHLMVFPGAAWKSEYGDPSAPGDFDFMYPLSPVHNVPTDRVLPATMLMISPGQKFPCIPIARTECTLLF
jgi:hypothetical protein